VATAQRVLGLPQVTLVHAGHEWLSERLPIEAKQHVRAVMFNLGYLPGAAKSLTTQTTTTLAAVNQALGVLAIGGLITIVLYPGHPGGGEEADGVLALAGCLPPAFAVTQAARINAQRPAPALLIIERLN